MYKRQPDIRCDAAFQPLRVQRKADGVVGVMRNMEGADIHTADIKILSGDECAYTALGNAAFLLQDAVPCAFIGIDGQTVAAVSYTHLHLMGLLGTGGVHSHIEHLFGLLDLAKHLGAKKVYVHCIMDGRDTDPHSGKGFLADLQKKLDELGVGEIATVTGRYYAMDRDSNWDREEKAYAAFVYGEGDVYKRQR